MALNATDQIRDRVDAIYRCDSRRILATLIRLLGDFDLAEEALQDAFSAALEQWRVEVPANPRAWLVSTGRFKAIDALRRRTRFDASLKVVAEKLDQAAQLEADLVDEFVRDDTLRLIFTCCHPALSPEARVALTLREVCDLTTEEIARAFLTAPSTIAQRIVRAKSKIRDARIPYQVPSVQDLPDRIDAVLHVVYLVFNEGYSASSGENVTRPELSSEAIRLCRLVSDLLREPEVAGLLALMLLQESRRSARVSPSGDLILLEDQDRSLWNLDYIQEGVLLVENSLRSRRFGRYTIQAAIAAVHAEAPQASETDWSQIVALYDVLLSMEPSSVVELNRAVAVAMKDGPGAGILLIEELLAAGRLSDYHLIHSARAELCRRDGRISEAKTSFETALKFAQQQPERRFLEARLKEIAE